MTVSRFTLLILSVLMCAISIQNSYADEAKTIQKKVATLALEVAAFNAVALPLNRMRTDNWATAVCVPLQLTGLYLGLRGLYSALGELTDIIKLKFDKDYGTKELILAIGNSDLKRVNQVIRRGADLNHPLYFENLYFGKRNISMFVKLAEAITGIRAYHDPAIRFRYNNPLTTACIMQEYDTVKTLLLHGADPNGRDEIGFSPLEIAAKLNSQEIMKLLLLHGALPETIESEYNNNHRGFIQDYRAMATKELARGYELSPWYKIWADLSDEERASLEIFLDYHTYHSRPAHKEAIKERAQSNGISENAELTIVGMLHGDKAASNEAEKREEKSRRERALRAIEEVGLE